MIYDMIVIGAGASGMTAAACAADPNMISDKKTDPASITIISYIICSLLLNHPIF